MMWTSSVGSSLLALAALSACAVGPGGSEDMAGAGGKADDGRSAVYPVDPRVHVRDPALDPLAPGGVAAVVPNAVAYAREVARRVDPAWKDTADVASLARSLSEAAARSGVTLAETAGLAAVTASAAAQQAYADEIRAGARGLAADAPLPRLAGLIVDERARIDACVARGHQPADCCRALAWLDVLAGGATLDLDSYAAVTAARVSAEAQPFSLLGAKAWLAACGPVSEDAPEDLDALRAIHGDYRGDTWRSELHPASMAKQAGRRIYRDRSGRSRAVVAESLDVDCSVRETEVIVRRADGALTFWTFDAAGRRVPHGYFPARKDVDAVKFAPDACMGCHYTFDTREFEVVAPSFAALQLVRVSEGGVPQWEDATGCRRADEPVIAHDAPVVDR